MLSRIDRLARRALHRARPRGLILMYHQVAASDIDPWGLRVSPANLTSQLRAVRRSAAPTTIDDLTTDRGCTRTPRVAVTFDDGFSDTLEVAVPALQDHGVPATVFVASAGLDGGDRCWWDVLAELLLRPGRLPRRLELSIDGHAHRWDLGADRHYGKDRAALHQCWRADDDPVTARHEVFLAVWRLLVAQPPHRQEQAIADLREWAGRDGTPRTRLLSCDEVRRLAAFDQVTIGGHTVHHPALPSLSASERIREIVDNRRYLQNTTGHAVEHFAYPYGRHCRASAAAVAHAGYRTAVTTHDAPVVRRSDAFALPRLQVPDLDGHAFTRWLEHAWLGRGGG